MTTPCTKVGTPAPHTPGGAGGPAHALNVVPKVVTDAVDQAALKRRAKEISESEWAAEAVRQAVQAMQAAIVSGATAGGAAGGS